MLRIGAACGSGLGSSFMVQMNIESILRDLGGATASDADVWIVGRDLADSASHLGDVRPLNSIIDMDELKEVVTAICQEKGLL